MGNVARAGDPLQEVVTASGIAPANGVSTVFWTGNTAPVAGTSGNNTSAGSANDEHWAEVYIPHNCRLTGIALLTGGTAGSTDKFIAKLLDNAGNHLAHSAVAGIAISATNQLLSAAFTSPYQVTGPGRYFISIIVNGTTDKFQSHTVTGSKFVAGSAASGGFDATGAAAAVTVGTTFTVNKGPIACTY